MKVSQVDLWVFLGVLLYLYMRMEEERMREALSWEYCRGLFFVEDDKVGGVSFDASVVAW